MWPDGRRAAVSVSFDNLGEAAEIALGLRATDDRTPHYSITTTLPIVLEELADAGLTATFFVEGINAERYPEALASIAGAGHEVGFHAWCHEEWNTVEDEAANVARGVAALRELGLGVTGFRPPGGLLGADTLAVLGDHGLTHCSPAGSACGVSGDVAVLPFVWPAVDVFHVLPQFEALRARTVGSPDAGGPDAALTALLAEVDRARATGGHAALVLHTWMAEGERAQLRTLLQTLAAADDLFIATHAECAAHVPPAEPVLDPTSWLHP